MKHSRYKAQLIVTLCFLYASTPVLAQQRPPRRAPDSIQPEVLYLTPEEEKDVIVYLREHYPERISEILQFKEKRPVLYRGTLSRAFREMRHMAEMQKEDPKRYEIMLEETKLDNQSRQIAREYREEKDSHQRDMLKEDLQKSLEKLFDYRQINRQAEIERLERKLEELKTQNRQRSEKKAEIVEQRLKELTQDDQNLEW